MKTAPLSISDRVAQVLQVSPELSLEEIRARLALEGIKVHHAQYNRAQAQLGLRAKATRKRRTKLPLPAELEAAPTEPPRKLVTAVSQAEPPDYAGMIAAIRAIHEERAALRALLQQILEVVDEALQ